MKKKRLILGISIILIIALFVLTGCSNKETDESNSQNNQDNLENFDSEDKSSNVQNSSENIIKAYFESIEKENKIDEYINTKIYYAMLLAGEYNVDYQEIYNALSDLDKGANYINENYKDFSNAMIKDFNNRLIVKHKEAELIDLERQKAFAYVYKLYNKLMVDSIKE